MNPRPEIDQVWTDPDGEDIVIVGVNFEGPHPVGFTWDNGACGGACEMSMPGYTFKPGATP